MIRAIERQFRVLWDEWIWMAVCVTAGSFFGMIFFYVILRLTGDTDGWFAMGTLLGAVIMAFYGVFMMISGITVYFNLEISMGCTRRQFFVSFYVVSFVANVIGVLLVCLICAGENAIGPMLYPNAEMEVDFLPFLMRWGLPAALAIPMLGGFAGVLILRFGRKAFWVLWALWMIGVLGLPQVLDAASEAPDSLYGKIGNTLGKAAGMVPENMWIVLLMAVSLAGFLFTYLFIRRQQVNR